MLLQGFLIANNFYEYNIFVSSCFCLCLTTAMWESPRCMTWFWKSFKGCQMIKLIEMPTVTIRHHVTLYFPSPSSFLAFISLCIVLVHLDDVIFGCSLFKWCWLMVCSVLLTLSRSKRIYVLVAAEVFPHSPLWQSTNW